MEQEEEIGISPRRHHSKPDEPQDIVFKIRQILNWTFIILGIGGGLLYSYGVWYRSNERIEFMGIIVVIIAVVVKMSECMLRLKK